MSKDQTFQQQCYTFLYKTTAVNALKPFVTYPILILHTVLLSLSFFLINSTQTVVLIALVSSPTLAIVLLATTALTFLQIVLALTKGLQFRLAFQLHLYRYFIFPMGLLYFVLQSQFFYITSPKYSYILFFTLGCFGYIVNYIIHTFGGHEITRKLSKSSSLLIVSDMLFYSMGFSITMTFKQYLIVFLLIIHLLLRYKLKKEIFVSTAQKFEFFTTFVKDICVFSYIIKDILHIQIDYKIIVLFSAPIFLIVIIFQGLSNKKFQLNAEIFTGKADLKDFLQAISLLMEDLQMTKQNQNTDFYQSRLLVFIALHKDKCNNVHCVLQHKSTTEELKLFNSSHTMKLLRHKIIKKIEYLFEVYEEKYYDSIELKLLFQRFYVSHLPNRAKIQGLNMSLVNRQLTWDDSLVLYGLNRHKEFFSKQSGNLDLLRHDQDLQQFKKNLFVILSCYQELWSLILEQKVDVCQLEHTIEKLSPLKTLLQKSWKWHLNIENFSSWKILVLYTLYRRSILKDYTNSLALEDYCKILEGRLKSKHQSSYINSQTEEGVIAISLSESSLGGIILANSQSIKMFSYANKQQLRALRVNDIMPSVYSVVHDNILNSFLKNRYKRLNQDQRLLYGKNKSGFLFPLLLQLRTLSWSSNDQLIFIALLLPEKLKSASICCICDLEGNVQDYSCSFAWLFMKKIQKKERLKKKNIQELIPNFFEVFGDEQILPARPKNIFADKAIIQKNGNKIEVQFKGSQIYIKQERVGYLVEGEYVSSIEPHKQIKKMSEILRKNNERRACENKYNTKQLCYEMNNKIFNIQSKRSNQITIPFFQRSDIKDIISLTTSKKIDYGKNIRTVRFINGKIEHILQEQSFCSQNGTEEAKEFSIINRVQKLKDQLVQGQQTILRSPFRNIIIIMTILLVGISLFSIKFSFKLSDEQTSILREHSLEMKMESLMKQYLIAIYFMEKNNFLENKSLSIRRQLQETVSIGSLTQQKKEYIYRIIFNAQRKQFINYNQSISQIIFNQQTLSSSEDIKICFYFLIVISCIYLLIGLLIFFIHKSKLFKVYLIFATLKQDSLHQMILQAKKIQQIIAIQKANNSQDMISTVQQNLTQQAQFQRTKKFKNEYNVEDLLNIGLLIAPIILILIFSIICSSITSSNLVSLKHQFDDYDKIASLFPQNSYRLLKSLISNGQITDISFSEKIHSYQQQFQYILRSNSLIESSHIEMISQKPCTNPEILNLIPFDQALICQESSDFYGQSVLNIMNYLYELLNHPISSSIDWQSITKLQFSLIKAVLWEISSKFAVLLQEMIIDQRNKTMVLALSFLASTILIAVYIIKVPIQNISRKLGFASEIIKILPADRQNMPDVALAAFTNEAFDTQ